MSKDFPIPNLDGEETVVGVHASGIQLEEGLNTSTKRNYCSKCDKNTHCYVSVNKKTKEAKIHKTCTNDTCECKCRTHYACKQCGYLHPYGEKCDRHTTPQRVSDSAKDAEFEKKMAKWRKTHQEKTTIIKKDSKP